MEHGDSDGEIEESITAVLERIKRHLERLQASRCDDVEIRGWAGIVLSVQQGTSDEHDQRLQLLEIDRALSQTCRPAPKRLALTQIDDKGPNRPVKDRSAEIDTISAERKQYRAKIAHMQHLLDESRRHMRDSTHEWRDAQLQIEFGQRQADAHARALVDASDDCDTRLAQALAELRSTRAQADLAASRCDHRIRGLERASDDKVVELHEAQMERDEALQIARICEQKSEQLTQQLSHLRHEADDRWTLREREYAIHLEKVEAEARDAKVRSRVECDQRVDACNSAHENQRAEADRLSAQQRLADAEALAAIRAEHDALVERIATLTSNHAAYVVEHERCAEELKRARLDRTNTQLRERLVECERRIQTTESESAGCQQRLADVRVEMTEAIRGLRECQAQLGACEERRAADEALRQARIASLTARLAERERDLSLRVAEYERKSAQYDECARALDQQRERLRAQSSHAETAVMKTLESHIKRLEASGRELAEQLRACEERCRAAQVGHDECRQRLMAADARLRECRETTATHDASAPTAIADDEDDAADDASDSGGLTADDRASWDETNRAWCSGSRFARRLDALHESGRDVGDVSCQCYASHNVSCKSVDGSSDYPLRCVSVDNLSPCERGGSQSGKRTSDGKTARYYKFARYASSQPPNADRTFRDAEVVAENQRRRASSGGPSTRPMRQSRRLVGM